MQVSVKTFCILALAITCSACGVLPVKIDVKNAGIFHPKPARIVADTRFENIQMLAKDGTKLQAYWLATPGAKLNVLWLGNSASAAEDTLADVKTYAEKMQANILTVNYRGYGKSEGQPDWDLLFSDGVVALETLRARKEAQGKPVVVHGSSLGSFVATDLAAHETVDALIVQGSGTNIKEWVKYKTPWILRPFVVGHAEGRLAELDSLKVMAQVKAPILIMSSKGDEDAPREMSENLSKVVLSSSHRFHVFEQVGHKAYHTDPQYWMVLRGFLNEAKVAE